MSNDQPLSRLSGFYLLGNGYRAYCPVLRQFNRPDSLSPFGEGGLNAYAYCLGDPVNASDPTGHRSWLVSVMSYLSRALVPLRARAFVPVPVDPELPRSWPQPRSFFRLSSSPKNYEGVLTYKLLAKLHADELSRMRLVSSGVRARIDSFSARNLRRYLDQPQHSWFPDTSDTPSNVRAMTFPELAIRVAVGHVPGVSLSHASRLMPLSRARQRFARENQGRWRVWVGVRDRMEDFESVPLRQRRIRGT